MECVLGPLKFQLMMTTVTRMETVFIIKVKRRYFAMSGSTRDVGGRILDTSSRNTTSDSRMLMPKVTYEQTNSRSDTYVYVEFHAKINLKFAI